MSASDKRDVKRKVSKLEVRSDLCPDPTLPNLFFSIFLLMPGSEDQEVEWWSHQGRGMGWWRAH